MLITQIFTVQWKNTAWRFIFKKAAARDRTGETSSTVTRIAVYLQNYKNGIWDFMKIHTSIVGHFIRLSKQLDCSYTKIKKSWNIKLNLLYRFLLKTKKHAFSSEFIKAYLIFGILNACRTALLNKYPITLAGLVVLKIILLKTVMLLLDQAYIYFNKKIIVMERIIRTTPIKSRTCIWRNPKIIMHFLK